MLDNLQLLPTDPILGLIGKYNNDSRENKIDLGVGVYKTASGQTPVLNAVKSAEQNILDSELSKSYLGPAGDIQFNRLITELALGVNHVVIKDKRFATLQTPGGCGALRVGAELIKSAHAKASIWVSDPTWANHVPLLGNVGFELKTYPYYDHIRHAIHFEGMVDTLKQAQKGDIVLLHACCHNPSGADLTLEQWQVIAELVNELGVVPFVDMAYQGFGDGLDQDAEGLRLLSSYVPEMLLAFSCSKNFGLYKERVGAIVAVTKTPADAMITQSHMMSIVRGIYSMPPAHGAAVVAEILSSELLTQKWHSELNEMSARIRHMRHQFCDIMRQKYQTDRFDFIESQKGMFSFLGIDNQQVKALAKESGIYMTDDSRVSLSGLNETNLAKFCQHLNSQTVKNKF